MKLLAVLLLLTLTPDVLAQCAQAQQDGTLFFTADTLANCSGYWLVPATEYNAYVSSVEITAFEIGEAFTWGFGTIVFFAFLAYQIDVAHATIRRI